MVNGDVILLLPEHPAHLFSDIISTTLGERGSVHVEKRPLPGGNVALTDVSSPGTPGVDLGNLHYHNN